MQVSRFTEMGAEFWAKFLARWQQSGGREKLPRGVSLLLVLLLAYSLAQVTWLVVTSSLQVSGAGQAVTIVKTTRQVASQPESLRSVARLHLFGVVTKEIPKPSNVPIEAPDTRLKLVLRGVLASDDPNSAFAIIAEERKKERAYGIGAALPGGAELHGIYADRVILRRNGRLETLRLPRKRSNVSITKGARKTSSTRPPQSRPLPPAKSLKDLRRALVSNPQQIWDHARIEPAMDETKNIKGYKVMFKDRRLMREIGLRKNDIVTEVNGLPANDPTTLYQLFEQLKESQEVSLTIERNGKIIHLTM